MKNDKQPVCPWTPEDERGHFPSIIEWWCMEGFFKTVEDNKKWSFKTTFTEWFETKPKNIGSLYNLSLFNLEAGTHFLEYTRNESKQLESKKDCFDVKFEDCYLKGLYPDYEMKTKNRKKNVELQLKYHAKSLPYWVAQQITGGHLPMGLGSYRYGFIPDGNLSGTIRIDEKKYTVVGKGYYEHVWGNFSYTNPFRNLSEYKKTLSTYAKLIGRQIGGSKVKIPKSIAFSTENNPLSFDWAWALLDNGWSIFYGNVLFWIMQGPVLGTLILTKDGKTYHEFKKISFRYNKTRYAKCHGFYYPTDLELTAETKKEKLHLRFKMENDAGEYIRRFADGKIYVGYSIIEAPGVVEGFYSDGKEKIKLTGICKIEIQRQVSRFGHNMLKLDFLLPPKGVGITIDLDSHLLEKKISTKVQLAPSPKIKFNIKRIDRTKIHKNIQTSDLKRKV